MSWLQKILPPKINKLDGTKNSRKAVPEGLWSKCPSCEAVLYQAELEKSLQVCPKCSHHGRLNARQRLDSIFDEGKKRLDIGQTTKPVDFLKFVDSKKYKDR
jgi:acetyl-CoA carboxylase carboxyl transferase subunit beta